MSDISNKIDSHILRANLSKYLKDSKGETIYITRYNKLIAELRVYSNEIKIITELRIAEKMLETAVKEKIRVS